MSHSTSVTSRDDKTAAERSGKVIVLPGQTPDGEYILSVLVKRSYRLVPGQHCVRAEADLKLFPAEVFYDDPMNSAVKYESDFIPYKVATDVVFNAWAYAPDGRPVQALTASVAVAGKGKDILVIGDRACCYREDAPPVFTEPEPFTRMEIRYERAYGGTDIWSDPKVPCAYARNHLGRGFVIGSSRKVIDKLPLPNLEDPKQPLTPERLATGHFIAWERQPLPQSFGWVSKIWRPRSLLAGVLPADRRVEQEMRRVYAAALPPEQREVYASNPLPDMDFRFFNGAQPELTFPFLTGEEEMRTVNLSPEGELNFQLPGERPGIGLEIGSGIQEPPVVLHTVMVRMEERQVDLVWRGAVSYPGPDWLSQMRKMEVLIQ